MTTVVDSDAAAAPDVEAGDHTSSATEPFAGGVVFSKLTCAVVKKDLVILKGISGGFEASRLTAVMGKSGSGKTTLLDAIAGRCASSTKLSGDVIVAGSKPTEIIRKRYTGYCEQHDTLVDCLTVREMLECTAELKCSARYPSSTKKQRVVELLSELGLTHVAESFVGGASARGISGGQRKRCNIGVALITKPALLFLDEPTSGLDAATADDILAVISKLAREGGRCVAATLHSPSSRAFRLLVDDVLCMSQGRVLWFGAPGEGSDGPLGQHLAEKCGAPFVHGDSLADHMMYVFDVNDDGSSSAELASKWGSSELGRDLLIKVQKASSRKSTMIATEGSLAFHPLETRFDSAVATSSLHGVMTLFKYRSRRSFMDADYVGARLGDKIVFATIMASLYWGEGSKQRDLSHVQNTAGVLWFVSSVSGFAAAAYIPQLVLERPLFLREVADGCYSPLTYLIFKMAEELTVILPCSLFFCAVLYFAVQLPGSFLFFWISYYLTITVAIALAYLTAAFSPNLEVANAALPTYVTILLLFSGYVINYTDIPEAWRWFVHLNFIWYSWAAMMKDTFEDARHFVLDGDRVTILDVYDIQKAPSKGLCLLALFLLALIFLAGAHHGLKRRTRR